MLMLANQKLIETNNKQNDLNSVSMQVEADVLSIHSDISSNSSQNSPPFSASSPISLTPSSPTQTPRSHSDSEDKGKKSDLDSDSDSSDIDSKDEKEAKKSKSPSPQRSVSRQLDSSSLLQPQSPRTAKFSTTLSKFVFQENFGKPIELYLYVSLGKNRRGVNPQTGSDLEAFTHLLNNSMTITPIKRGGKPIPAISKIKVVLSGSLYAAYVGEKAAKEAEESWRETQGKLLAENLAQEFKFDQKTDILDWETTVAKNPLYDRALSDIQALYRNDETFQKIIDEKLVKEHSSKYKLSTDTKDAAEAVKKYIFGECAAFLIGGKVVAYPAPRFNDAVQYVLDQKTGKGTPPYPGSKYLGYEFKNLVSLQDRISKIDEEKDTKKKGSGSSSKQRASLIPLSPQCVLSSADVSRVDVMLLLQFSAFREPVMLKQLAVLQKTKRDLLRQQLAFEDETLKTLELVTDTASATSTGLGSTMTNEGASSNFGSHSSSTSTNLSTSVSCSGQSKHSVS